MADPLAFTLRFHLLCLDQDLVALWTVPRAVVQSAAAAVASSMYVYAMAPARQDDHHMIQTKAYSRSISKLNHSNSNLTSYSLQ